MSRQLAVVFAWVLIVGVGTGVAQVTQDPPQTPSSVETLLQEPAVEIPEVTERFGRRSGVYAAAGVLVAPPILFNAIDFSTTESVLVFAPLPSPWATIGFRGAKDVSWQASFMLVPIYDANDWLLKGPYRSVTFGFDVDRISTNRSSQPDLDLRWQYGLRLVGIGLDGVPAPLAIGPHVGRRAERQLGSGLSAHVWGDVGLLPSLLMGIPLVDLRSEFGLTWRSERRPGLSVSVAAFQETIGFVVVGLITPGIKVHFGWNF